MVTKGRRKGTTRFSVKPGDGARKVCLAGDFNGWTPAAMRKQKDGLFAATLSLDPGCYDYKFVVDGQWVVDPDNSTLTINPFGTFNSVAEVV